MLVRVILTSTQGKKKRKKREEEEEIPIFFEVILETSKPFWRRAHCT